MAAGEKTQAQAGDPSAQGQGERHEQEQDDGFCGGSGAGAWDDGYRV